MNPSFSVLLFAGGVLLVWSGISNPEGGLTGAVGRVLRGEAQPAARTASTASDVLAYGAAFYSGGTAGTASGGAVSAGYTGASKAYPGLGVKAHVQRAAEILGGKYGITTILGFGTRDNASDHPLGLALDFMTKDQARGTALASDAQQNAGAYGVTYVIWRQRIWSVGRAAEGWRNMPDRGGDTANHFDHVHVSFKASAPASGTVAA